MSLPGASCRGPDAFRFRFRFCLANTVAVNDGRLRVGSGKTDDGFLRKQ